MAAKAARDFECVDPDQQHLVAARDGGTMTAADRRELADHLAICDACRLQVAAEDCVAATLATPARHRRRLVGGLGAGLLAASLAGMLILPPVPDTTGLRRDGAATGFLRPVEGEVVSGSPSLTWRPVAGATAYNIELSEVGSDWMWADLVRGPKALVPVKAAMPLKGRFRGVVRPVPADLAGPVDITVGFRRDSTWRMLGYRLGHAPAWLWAGFVVGLGGLLVAAIAGRRRPRVSGPPA